MAFTNFGSTKAAAHRIDFQGMIRNLVEQEQLTNAAIQQRKQEVQYYAEKMKTATSDIPHIQGRLDEFNEKKMNEIGRFSVENPNFEMDVKQMAQFNTMTGELLNNSIITEGETSKKNYQAFQEAYNKGELTTEEFVQYSKDWENYQQNGGDGVPFQFGQPERFTMDQMVKAGSELFQTTRGDAVTRGKVIGQDVFVNDADAYRAASVMYADPTYRASIQTMYKDMTGMFDSPEEMMFQMLKGSKETGFDVQGIDPGYTYAQRYAAEQRYETSGGGNVPAYIQNVWNVLQNKDSTGRMIGAAALTDAGMESINMGDPKNNISIENDDGTFSTIKDLPYNAKVLGDGAGRVFKHGGSQFVSFDVSFEAPADQEEVMKDYGFTPNFTRKEGINGQFEFILNTEQDKNPGYSGTIVMPFRGYAGNIAEYERAYGTTATTRGKMQGTFQTIESIFDEGDIVPEGATDFQPVVEPVPAPAIEEKGVVQRVKDKIQRRKAAKTAGPGDIKDTSFAWGVTQTHISPNEHKKIMQFMEANPSLFPDGGELDKHNAVDVLVEKGLIPKE